MSAKAGDDAGVAGDPAFTRARSPPQVHQNLDLEIFEGADDDRNEPRAGILPGSMRDEPQKPVHARMGVANNLGNVSCSLANLDNDVVDALSHFLSHSGWNMYPKDITRDKVPQWNHGKEPFISF